MAQLACADSELPQPFVAAKSPVAAAVISVSATSPAFVSVTCCTALADPIDCGAKSSAVGDNASVAGDTPVPRSEPVSGVPSPVIEKLPLRAPDAVGLKTMETVQPVLTASVAPQVFAAIAKSPVTVAAPRATLVPPVFETVMFCASPPGAFTEIGRAHV